MKLQPAKAEKTLAQVVAKRLECGDLSPLSRAWKLPGFPTAEFPGIESGDKCTHSKRFAQFTTRTANDNSA
jgi:hypothetical protein